MRVGFKKARPGNWKLGPGSIALCTMGPNLSPGLRAQA